MSAVLRAIYPLKSGLGTIANSKILKALDGNPEGDINARSGRFTLVVPQYDYVGRSIKYFGDLDKKVTWVVRKVLKPGDHALDIGANLGLVSFKMLESVGPTGKVTAIEPQSRMVKYIEQSVFLNRIENLQIHRLGLAEKPGILRLSIPEYNAGAASFSRESGSHFENVSVTTLDDLSRDNSLNDVRLIKIDVEGFESLVFAGGQEFFAKVKPDVVVFEENQKHQGVPEAITIIQSYGYDVFSLPKAWLRVYLQPYKCGANAHDFVAVHKDAPIALRRGLGV